MPKEEKDKIESSLIKKINAYFSSKDKEKLESKKNDISPSLSKNLELIKELLLTSYDKDTFCKKYNIESQNFNQILASIKRYDINLYNKCVTELKTREDKNNIESINMIKKLVYYLENGVNINGLVRKFDILDYYFLTDIPHYKIMDLPLQLKGKSLKLLKNFVEKNKNGKYELTLISVDKVMNERNIYGCKFDENRKYIEGTGREITALEKEKIIEFFNEHNIPLLDKVYYTALRRYASANLCIENDIDIVRIRQKNKFNE